MAASPSAATASTGPFTLSLKSGLGLFGSPDDSPLVFSSQFSLSLAKPFVPSFSLLLKPQFGNFCLRKSTVSSPNDQFSAFQPSDGVRLDPGSASDPKFGSGFAVDESMGWQELKLETSSGHGSQEEFGVQSTGGIFQRHLDETKSIRDGVFSGVAVMARTAIPVTKRVAVNFRWGMNFPTNPVTKMPFLTVNKISVERVEEEKEEKKTTVEEGGDVELLKGMLFWMKKDVETLEKENREMKQILEEMKLGSMGNGAAPSSGLNYGDELEPWRRSNRSGWEESKSKNKRNGGQENDWRKKKSTEEENEGKNNRRGGEKNGSKGHSSTNRANEVESELERAIKAASQVKA